MKLPENPDVVQTEYHQELEKGWPSITA